MVYELMSQILPTHVLEFNSKLLTPQATECELSWHEQNHDMVG